MRAGAEQPGSLTKSVAAAIGQVNPTLALTFEPLDRRVSATLRLLGYRQTEHLVSTRPGFYAMREVGDTLN